MLRDLSGGDRMAAIRSMKKARHTVFSALLAVLCAGCAWRDPAAGISVKRPTDVRINGFRRTYELHLPDGYKPEQTVPLLVAVHGAFSTAEKMEQETGFSALADEYGFIAAYPNGMGIAGLLQHWNAGHCCGKAAKDGIDDVGFLRTVIEDIRKNFLIDRVYMIGFSNGGMLVHRFAAEQSGGLAGAAVVAGAIGGRASKEEAIWQIPEPEAPVPMLIIHSRTDAHVPYDGGGSSRRSTNEREYLSVDEAVAFWAKHNRCGQSVETVEMNEALVERQRWTGEAPVELYALENWPHVWPGPFFSDRGDLNGFDASAVILRFFGIKKIE